MSGCLSPSPSLSSLSTFCASEMKQTKARKNFLVGSPKTRVLYRCLCVQVCESIKIPLEKELEISQSNGANGADNNNNSNINSDSNVDATRCDDSSCRLQLTAESKIKRLHKVQA